MRVMVAFALVILGLGNSVGRAEGAPPDVTVDRGRSFVDLWLAATTEVALFAERRISGEEVGDIAVHADGGRIVLRGVVDSADAWHAASAVAGRVPGVTSVGNRLRIVPATAPIPRDDEVLARDVAEALRQTRALDGARIRVRVAGAVVDLFGSVRDVSDWALTSRAARDVVGVHAVDNHLAIEHLELSGE